MREHGSQVGFARDVRTDPEEAQRQLDKHDIDGARSELQWHIAPSRAAAASGKMRQALDEDDINSAKEALQSHIEARRKAARKKGRQDRIKAVLSILVQWVVIGGLLIMTMEMYFYFRDDGAGDGASISPVALLGALGAVTGASIAAVVGLRTLAQTTRLRGVQEELSYVNSQLQQLWGPLYGKLRTTQGEYRELLNRLGKQSDRSPGILSCDPFTEDWGDPYRRGVWEEFIGRFFLKNNEELRELLVQNYSLIGPTPPADDIRCLFEHEAEFRVKWLRTEDIQQHRDGIDSVTTDTGPLTCRFPAGFLYHAEYKLLFLQTLQRLHWAQIQRRPSDPKLIDLREMAEVYRAAYELPQVPGYSIRINDAILHLGEARDGRSRWWKTRPATGDVAIVKDEENGQCPLPGMPCPRSPCNSNSTSGLTLGRSA